MKTAGLITIGQTPREDLLPQFRSMLGAEYRLLEAGALDDIGAADIASYAPQRGQHPLITRLLDGNEVVVAKEAILARLQACVTRLSPDCDVLAVLCTGTFPRWKTQKPVLEPDRLLFTAASASYSTGTLGVIIPIAGQGETAAAHWSRISPKLAIEVASPYQDPATLAVAGSRLARTGVTLTVIDCMGFTEPQKRILREATGAPVLLPTSLLARFIAELA